MAEEQKKQIFEYIFGKQDVPVHLKDEFSRWLLDHEDDPETEALLLEKWEQYSKTLFEEDDLKGLKGVRTKILDTERKKECRKRRLAVCFSVLAAIILFFAGAVSSTLLKETAKEITLITADDNIGEFRLPDGTKVWLNERSRLTYNEKFSRDERRVTLSGEAFFEVMKEPERPFRVMMGNIDVEVLGTSFGASCYKKDSKEEVILKSGSVKVSCADNNVPITLKPNERLTYSPFDGNICVDTIDVDNLYRWYERYLSFDNARFGDILANIEHRYRVHVKPLTSVSMDKRLSMTIIHEPLEVIMDVMSTLLPIRYEIHNDSLIIRDKYSN
jgi:ferric-dicitrate binding protein FerR (iron transport regulator)